jgi:hypothetical protein
LSNQGDRVERDAAHCPFCGANAVDWENESCIHLIADFGDRSDGDRGIMCGSGGSRCGNAALDCLTSLEHALQVLVETVKPSGYLEKTPGKADKAALVRASGFGDQAPHWLEVVLEVLDDGEGVDGFNINIDSTIESIWSAGVPWSDGLVKTSSYIGSMASTDVTFVWASDPKDGANQISKSAEQIEHEIRKTIDRLARSSWRVTHKVSDIRRIGLDGCGKSKLDKGHA